MGVGHAAGAANVHGAPIARFHGAPEHPRRSDGTVKLSVGGRRSHISAGASRSALLWQKSRYEWAISRSPLPILAGPHMSLVQTAQHFCRCGHCGLVVVHSTSYLVRRCCSAGLRLLGGRVIPFAGPSTPAKRAVLLELLARLLLVWIRQFAIHFPASPQWLWGHHFRFFT